MSKKYSGVYKNDSNGMYYFVTRIKNGSDGYKSVRSKSIYESAFECCKAKELAQMQGIITTPNVKNEQQAAADSTIITSVDVKKSVSSICDLLLVGYENGRKSTYQVMKKIVDNYFKDYYPRETTINQLCSLQAINDYVVNLKAKGFTTDYNNKILSVYRKLCDVAFYDGAINQLELGIVKNNLKMLKDDGSISHIEKKQFFTEEEYLQFISSIDDYRYKALFDLLFYGGTRIAECLAIQVKDILPNGYINIDKQRLPDGTITNVLKTKNSYRKIPIKKSIYIELIDYANKYQLKENDLLFNTSRTSIQRVLNKAIEDSKVEYLNKHGFRHSCCSYLCNIFTSNNKPINFLYVANYLGDTISTVQQVYAHLSSNTIDDIQSLMDSN